MVKILVKKLDPSIELPAYKTEGASGMDLMAFIKEPIVLKSQNSCLVPTGIAVAFSNELENILSGVKKEINIEIREQI